MRGVVTGPSRRGTMRDTLPLAAVEWQAMTSHRDLFLVLTTAFKVVAFAFPVHLSN
jgi:hypothetical protein